SLINAIAAIVQCLGFAIFGMLLLRRLGAHLTTYLARRLAIVAVTFGAAFAGESAILLITTLTPGAFVSNFLVVNAVFFGLDVIALSTVLLLFSRLITDSETETKCTDDGQVRSNNEISRFSTHAHAPLRRGNTTGTHTGITSGGYTNTDTLDDTAE